MFLNKNIGVALTLTGLALALACGGGKSSTSAASVTTTINGVIDDQSGLSKPMNALSPATVRFINIDTQNISQATLTGNSFTVTVYPGDFDVVYTGTDSKVLRSYVRASSNVEDNDTVGVNLNSTIIAELIDSLGANLSSLPTIESLVSDGNNILLNAGTYTDEQRSIALLSETLRHQIKIDISSGNYQHQQTYSQATLKSQANVMLGQLINSGNIYLSSGNTLTTVNEINNYNFNNINIQVKNIQAPQREKMLIVGAAYSPSASSSLSVIDVNTLALNKDVKTYSITDITSFSYGRHYYTLGRYQADFLDRFDIENPGISLYKSPYSTLAAAETSSLNPQSLIFQNNNKALLTRYGTGTQWLVNPKANIESDFFLRSIDLSHYDNDNIPEFGTGVFVSGNYFLAAQRLTNYLPSSNAYVVVLDASGNEINTGKSASGDNLMGIAIPARNPQEVIYNETTGLLYMLCSGQYGASWNNSNRQFTGGILTINPHTYEISMLVNDDSSNESTDILTGGGLYGGLFSHMAIVSATKGYIGIYSAWGDASLRTFNPTTGAVGNIISGITEVTQLVVDSQNRLWILSGSGVKILETTTDSVTNTITGFTVPPIGITHLRY